MAIVSLYDFNNPAMPDLRLNHSKLGAVHLKAFGPEDEPTSVFVAHQYALCEALYYDALKTQGPTSKYFRICAAYLNNLNGATALHLKYNTHELVSAFVFKVAFSALTITISTVTVRQWSEIVE